MTAETTHRYRDETLHAAAQPGGRQESATTASKDVLLAQAQADYNTAAAQYGVAAREHSVNHDGASAVDLTAARDTLNNAYRRLRALGAPRLVAEFYVADDGAGNPVIWHRNPLNPFGDDAAYERTTANAGFFDAVAAILPTADADGAAS